jgi:hypothetical protein
MESNKMFIMFIMIFLVNLVRIYFAWLSTNHLSEEGERHPFAKHIKQPREYFSDEGWKFVKISRAIGVVMVVIIILCGIFI